MRSRLAIGSAALLIAFSTLPARAGKAVPDDHVLATVDGMTVTAVEFQQAAARITPEDGETLSEEERREVLEKLISEEVLYLEALRVGLDQDPKVKKVMVNTLLRNEVYAQVRNSDFSERMLLDYWDAHLEEFVVPEKVQIKRILIKVHEERSAGEALAEAERLYGMVAAAPKESFKDVASEHSEDPYRRRGGDIGFVSRDGKPGLDMAIVERAFAMETYQVSEPFETDEGYNIIWIANRRERVERTFQQMKGSVLRKVKNEHLEELYQDYVDQLRGDVEVDIDERALRRIEVRTVSGTSPALPGSEEEGEASYGL